MSKDPGIIPALNRHIPDDTLPFGELTVTVNDNGTATVQWRDGGGIHTKVLSPGDTFRTNPITKKLGA